MSRGWIEDISRARLCLALSGLTIAGASAAHPLEMAAALAEVKKVMLDTIGHDSASVELTAGTYMLTVTIINSRLANSPSRDAEAHKIADALTRAIAAKSELATRAAPCWPDGQAPQAKMADERW